MGVPALWWALVGVLWVSGGHCYRFQPGFVHLYTYTATNTMMSQQKVTSVLKYRVSLIEILETGERRHSLHVDSFVQFMEGGQFMDNPQKWDLSKNFVFVSNATGSVTMVHVHPEDHPELIVLKKALASVFSVHVQIDEENDGWEYTSQEIDHLGLLHHRYNGRRTSTGMTLNRKHVSEDNVRRSHDKTLHYDQLGSLRSAQIRDHVMVSHFTQGRKHREPWTEDFRKVTSTGDQPIIEATAHVDVKYDGKKRLTPEHIREQSHGTAQLQSDSLQTQYNHTKTSSTFGLGELLHNITKTWDCIHYYHRPDAENKANCVNDLRKLLALLKPGDYERYVRRWLRENCSRHELDRDSESCQEDRWIMVDIAARMGDVTSQQLLVTHVLLRQPPSDEDLRRVFIHCAALERPTEDFVRSVEFHCFGVGGDYDQQQDGTGSRRVARTQGRACLAMGSLAKHLSNSGHQKHADKLAAKLETWLDRHEQGDSPRYRREANAAPLQNKNDTRVEEGEGDEEEEDPDHMGKALLLHALGNGALLRSRDHLLRHAKPNRGHHIWRRAALSALTQFSCEESARALLTSVTEDTVLSVRRVAWNGFVTHPRRHTLVKGKEDDLLSANYTYRSVARVKRSVLDLFDKVIFQFKIAVPSYEWNKDIGSEHIGGSMAVKFQNSIEGMFRILSGYVDVDVHDKLHADVHVLNPNYKVDLIHVEACYKGRLTYNMNIIKDFTVDLFKDITSVFDHIIGRIMEPLMAVARNMTDDYTSTTMTNNETREEVDDGDETRNETLTGARSHFEPLADAVKKLPSLTRGALNATAVLSQAAELVGGLPSVRKLQGVLSRTKTFLEDVHGEAAELFTNINAETLVALPFAEKEIKGAMNSVLGVLNKVTDYPNQVFSLIDMAKIRYKLAMSRIFDATKPVQQAFSFLTGGRSSWNSGREELNSVKDQIKTLVGKITADLLRRKKRQAATSFSPSSTTAIDDAVATLRKKSDVMLHELDVVTNQSPAELQRGLDLMKAQVETLKATFAAFKEAIDIVKSRIQVLFGAKFHQSFPSIRRDCDEQCGCGLYPTNCTRYGHPGVDLVWSEGWTVPSPVTGMVHVEALNTTLRIEPKTEDWKEYVIYISNVRLRDNYNSNDSFAVQAGDPLASSLGQNGCNKAHIHVAVRRTSNATGLCHYVDPTTFLTSNQPKIRWQRECNEFAFRHIGQVVDFSHFTAGFRAVLDKLKRAAMTELKNYTAEKLNDLVADDSFLKPLKDMGLEMLDSETLDPSTALKHLFTKGVNATKEFMNKIKTKYTIQDLLEKAMNLTGTSDLKVKLDDLIQTAKNATHLPDSLHGLDSLSTGVLTRLWKTVTGSFQNYTLSDLMSAEGRSRALSTLVGDLKDDLLGGLKDAVLGNSSIRSVVKDLANVTGLLDVMSAGKEKLVNKLKETILEGMCPELGASLKKQGSPCLPHTDCRGMSCVINVQKQHATSKVHVDVTVDINDVTASGDDVGSGRGDVRITVDKHEFDSVKGDAQNNVIPTNVTLFGSYAVKLRVTSLWDDDRCRLYIKLQTCGPDLSCLPDVTLAKNLSFSSDVTLSSLLATLTSADMDVQDLPLESSYKLTADLDVNTTELTNTIVGLQDLMRNELSSILPDNTTVDFVTEFQDPEEFADQGSFPQAGQRAEIYAQFFAVTAAYPVGPTWLQLRLSGGGVIGLTFNVTMKSADSLMQVTFTPYAAVKLEAGASIQIYVVGFGVDLHSWLLRTRFPLSISSNYTKQPVMLTTTIDLELIPVELELVAWVEVKISIVVVTIFSKRWDYTVWHWTASGVRGTIWQHTDRKNDLGPPRFPYCDRVDELCTPSPTSKEHNSNTSTSAVNDSQSLPAVCSVKQLPGRHPADAAITLDFTAEDDNSDLTITFAIGDYPGGTNVRSWTPLRGTTLTTTTTRSATTNDGDDNDDGDIVINDNSDKSDNTGKGTKLKNNNNKSNYEINSDNNIEDLPCGKPLYFLVRAKNSQGLMATAECSLPTLDCSAPAGRVDTGTTCTSHRDRLSATVVVYEDSPLKVDGLLYAVGFSPGSQGHEVIPWTPLVLDEVGKTKDDTTTTTARTTPNDDDKKADDNEGDYLSQFAPPRQGRLAISPLERSKPPYSGPTPDECARDCLAFLSCLSFSYDFSSFSCELQSVVEGVSAQRVTGDRGSYSYYEKPSAGHSSTLKLRDLALRHGVRYYVNAYAENVLGYASVLTSRGTMVDLTSPEPGYLGVGAVEVEVKVGAEEREGARRCAASSIQRCVDPAPVLAHRKFIDGEGSTTVMNGNTPGQEMRFTRDNTRASANWNGFEDGECGIYGYAWAVGTSVCGNDVSDFVDPRAGQTSSDSLPNVGVVDDLDLADGPYYVTVQAVSNIELGGDLVTTVCHSTPFIVDTAPPVIRSVNDVIFDDAFRLLAVYFDVTDAASGVARVEFGLGRTRHDVTIRSYRPFEVRGEEGSTCLLDEEFDTGTTAAPAWIRLKVTDNVGLSATGSGEKPILLDNNGPQAGVVLDGDKVGQDTCCTADVSSFCVQWRHFEDPQSHIDSYLWGVGLAPGQDDVVAFHRLPPSQRQSCVTGLTLTHNVTYISTIVALNKALNQKSVNVSSDGVLVDLTSPVAGRVVDGDDINDDANFTSESASVAAAWTGFRDPETDIASYTVSVFINDVIRHTASDLTEERFSEHSLPLVHGDRARVEVTAFNKAGSDVTVTSDGLTVDHTSPELVRIGTAAKSTSSSSSSSTFQNDDTRLAFAWEFRDPESAVVGYRASVFERADGVETLFWPSGSGTLRYQVTRLDPTARNTTRDLHLQGLSLVNGAAYVIQVTAVNRAKLSATARSDPVIIDTTRPVVEKIQISRPESDEELNELGQVEHIEGEPLTVSWKAHDFESGLANIRLCIGPVGSNCLTATDDVISLDPSLSSTATLDQTKLRVSTENEGRMLYEVLLVVVNGAGVRSAVARTRPLLVVKGNTAGVVLDGTSGTDQDVTNVRSGISLLFANFSSQVCGIDSYEWGVGSAPCRTDVLPFSDFGFVIDDREEAEGGSGSAQADIWLEEGKTYYSVVRAKTGHACHEPYIVSCSDGITLDTAPPQISFFRPLSSPSWLEDQDAFSSSSKDSSTSTPTVSIVYQTTDDKLELGWNIADESTGVNISRLTATLMDDQTPLMTLPVPVQSRQPFPLMSGPGSSPLPGQSLYASLWAADNAGNEAATVLPVVTFDTTQPLFRNFRCTNVVSPRSTLVTCTWTTVEDLQSPVTSIRLGLGRAPGFSDLRNMTAIRLQDSQWQVDISGVFVDGFDEMSEFYATGQVTNAAGLEGSASVVIRKDLTPPEVSDVIVVTSPAGGMTKTPKRCQTTVDFIEVDLRGLHDEESGIRSVDIALGTSKGTSDLHPFQPYAMFDGVYVKGDLGLPSGSTVYVTARVTNRVGLYSVVTSEGVAISPEPRLQVLDGPDGGDSDSQEDLNVIQGHWRFTDPCPVVTAEWSVTELGSGRVVRPFSQISDKGQRFYDDTVSLHNKKTYVNHVRVKDALGRVYVAFSDGVTVAVGIPATASVWEGSYSGGRDIDFQRSLQQLVASWDDFGDSLSALPSDHVVRYEASVGTDPLREQGRADIHAFVDLGLTNTHTFLDLNLTVKHVTYYVTVRAYSAVGSYSQASSDGIRAGFSDEIVPGHVAVSRYQSDTESIRATWDGFESDMGNLRYHLGIVSAESRWDTDIYNSSTVDCSILLNSSASAIFDTSPLHSAGNALATTLRGLSLLHNHTYFVTVVAEDLLYGCSAVTSGPVLVDTSRPEAGAVAVDNGYDSGLAVFLHSPETISVNVDTFVDAESGVEVVQAALAQSKKCDEDDPTRQEGGEKEEEGPQRTLLSVTAERETRMTLRGLNLQEGVAYLLRVTVTNGAGLSTVGTSKPLMLAVSQPSPGTVRLGQDWTAKEEPVFQSRRDSVQAVVSLLPAGADSDCSTEQNLVSPAARGWVPLAGPFSRRCTLVESSQITVTAQHSLHLTDVDKGAAQLSQKTPVTEGNYTFRLLPAPGRNILTSVSMASTNLKPPFPFVLDFLAPKSTMDTTDCAGADCSKDNSTSAKRERGLGFAFADISGEKKLMFWVQDEFKQKRSLLFPDLGLFSALANYTFVLKRSPGNSGSWEVKVVVGEKTESEVGGFWLPSDVTFSIYTWNVDDYFPPVTDPFDPFRAEARLTAVTTPLAGDTRPLCSFGRAFRDTVSGVKEVWAGVSDSVSSVANVAPFRRVTDPFCLPCLLECPAICSATSSISSSSCSADSILSDFRVVPFTVRDLSLEAADVVFRGSGRSSDTTAPKPSTSEDGAGESTIATVTTPTVSTENGSSSAASAAMNDFRLPMYYVDVKVVTHSGQTTLSKSQALTVDTSPPSVVRLAVTDPSFSDTDPVHFVGTNDTVGLRWEVSEDVSDVVAQWVSLGSSEQSSDDLVRWVSVDRLSTGHVFQHLGHLLQDETTYYASLRVTNAAGLSTSSTAHFTVSTSIPELFQPTDPSRSEDEDPTTRRKRSDASAIGVAAAASAVTPTFEGVSSSVRISGAEVVLMENSDSIVVNLPAVNPDLLYIEWSIGSSSHNTSEDVLPKVIVANPDISKVAIVHGRMELEGHATNITVKDYAKSSYSPSSHDPKDGEDPGSLFRMEPGRCLRQNLYGVSKSHRENSFDLTPLCFKRNSDKLYISEDNPSTISHDTPDGVHLTFSLSRGALIVGYLSPDDLDTVYGSAASAQFSPFVVRPDVTDPTSRSLRGRLLSTPGPYFFLSPVAAMSLADDLSASYTVPTSVSVPAEHEARLLVWAAESLKWKSIQDVCPSGEWSYDPVSRLTSSKICFETFLVDQATGSHLPEAGQQQKNGAGQQRRRKRDATDPFSSPLLAPRMFMIAVVNSDAQNSIPVVDNSSTFFITTELDSDSDTDSGTTIGGRRAITVNLTFSDADEDAMKFSIPEQPPQGHASVTPDGVMTYVPGRGYAGDGGVVIVVRGVEVLDEAALSAGLTPFVVNFTVVVPVARSNAPPDIVYLPGATNDSGPIIQQDLFTMNQSEQYPGLNVSILVEGNQSSSTPVNATTSTPSTTTLLLGTLLLQDPDFQDSITLLSRSPNVNTSAAFLVANTTYDETTASDLGRPPPPPPPAKDSATVADEAVSYRSSSSSREAKALSLAVPEDFRGFVSYEAKVKDASDAYSLPVTVGVHVLISPCGTHGQCQAKNRGGSCQDIRRAFSFEAFRCACDEGFQGEWCEIEVGSCEGDQCGFLTDCVAIPGGHRCELNLVQVAICAGGSLAALVVLLGTGVLLWVYKDRIDGYCTKRVSKMDQRRDETKRTKPPKKNSTARGSSSHHEDRVQVRSSEDLHPISSGFKKGNRPRGNRTSPVGLATRNSCPQGIRSSSPGLRRGTSSPGELRPSAPMGGLSRGNSVSSIVVKVDGGEEKALANIDI